MKKPTLNPQSKTFNWLTALEWLADGNSISPQEYDRLSYASGDWPACACGQLCKRLPRGAASGAPDDGILRELGVEFCGYVCASSWQSALDCFRSIEARTAQLLRAL